MTLKLIFQKLSCYGILLLGLILYWAIQRKIEDDQIHLKTLDREKRALIVKISQAQQLKMDRTRVSKDFAQAQQLGIISFDNQETLTQLLEQLSDSNRFQNFNYHIEYINSKQMNHITLHWYKIVFEFEHHQDCAIFQFIETLGTQLSGLILAEQLSLVRADSSAFEKNSSKGISGNYHIHLITFNPVINVK